jgi:ornithine cyclodeaminase
MNDIRFVDADELRAHVRFEDLIEPISKAFQESSAHLAENGLVVMFPGENAASGDVYVKTGTLRGHTIYVVKVSPWFAANVALGRAQGGFIGWMVRIVHGHFPAMTFSSLPSWLS